MESAEVLAQLEDGVSVVADVDFAALPAEDLLVLVRDVEVAARRLSAVQVALADALDRTGAHSVDGHRTAKSALVHLGRLSGPEAHRRIRTARAVRSLPAVAAAFAEGTVPAEMAHAVGRAASNPRVGQYLDTADPIFAEQAATDTHEGFVNWLAEWERLADADGAAQDSDAGHRRRGVSMSQNQSDGSWRLRGQLGALQGAVLVEVLSAFESAEALADHDDAVALFGPDVVPGRWARTAPQRRADALVAMAERATSTSPSSPRRGPLVNIVCDQRSFEEALARIVGGTLHRGWSGEEAADDLGAVADPLGGAVTRICTSLGGSRVDPTDAVVAAAVGHVRRVIVDGDGRVIDLGRRQRLFSGASREVALIQGALARYGLSCLWSGCSAPPAALQVDHGTGWRAGGATSPANAELLCGHHNRLKESGYTPVRGPDGAWTFHRPDGTPITPAA